MEKWEDISIINEAQLAAHCSFDYEEKISLNGIWNFRCVLDPDQADPDFYKDGHDLSSFEKIDVPSCLETRGYGKPYYFGADFPKAINKSKKKIPSIDHKKTYCAQYKREVDIPASYLHGQTVLRFDSVKSAFYCYVNEHYAGMSKGSMLPCEFDITKYLKEGKNTVSVMVFQFSDATYIEDQDMWFLSGIYRDVYLYHREEAHIEDVFLHCDLLNDYKDAVLYCDATASKEGSFALKILDQEVKEKTADNKVSLSVSLSDVKLWSAEHPELYPVAVTYECGDMKETQHFRFGFREDKVDHEKALYLHNGQPIKLRGINYHAFSPDDGYYVSQELYRKDLKLLKQANINAIRTSHYPQADIFYDLCDELGFYVMDECNVESHGVREKNVPGDDPRWTPHVVDRMERMVLRDRSHACVSIYSLGNESACGENHFRMKGAALKLDSSRPIHYEGGRNLKLSDFLCDGYASLDRVRKFADKEDVKDKPTIVQRLIPLLMSLNSISYEEYRHHPIVLTEYGHSMGNSGSDVEEFVRIMDGCEQYCGGFIWDFKDKALRKDGKLLYGGDFGSGDQNGDFCCNGICDADSRPHSVYYEIAHAFQPLVITRTSEKTVSVYNRNFFTSSADYVSYYTVTQNGNEIYRKRFTTDVLPRQEKEYTLDFPIPQEDSTCYLNVFFEKGASSSIQQFPLKEKMILKKQPDTCIQETTEGILLADTYGIEKSTGDLSQILCGGNNILKTPLRPSLYRPYTDGDLGFIGLAMKRQKALDRYGKASLFEIKGKPLIRIEKDRVFVTDFCRDFTLVRIYEVSDEKLHLTVTLNINAKKAPNRIGMQAELDSSFDTLFYFGKGPHDTYPGKDDSGLIASYLWKIDEQDDYVRPQEHGNKSHVKNARLISEKAVLMIEKGGRDLNISFWPYTLKDLHEADHIFDLPDHPSTTLNIDGFQNGLSDCFVKCDPKYLIKAPATYSYDFYLSVEKAGQDR